MTSVIDKLSKILNDAEENNADWQEFINGFDEFSKTYNNQEALILEHSNTLTPTDILEWFENYYKINSIAISIIDSENWNDPKARALEARLKKAITKFFNIEHIIFIDYTKFSNPSELGSETMFSTFFIPIHWHGKNWILDEIQGQGESYFTLMQHDPDAESNDESDLNYKAITKWFDFEEIFNEKTLTIN